MRSGHCIGGVRIDATMLMTTFLLSTYSGTRRLFTRGTGGTMPAWRPPAYVARVAGIR